MGTQRQGFGSLLATLSLPVIVPPPGLAPPPGFSLPTRPPPGLYLPNESPRSALPPTGAHRAHAVDGAHIHWCVDRVSEKLLQSRGCPLTSHVFESDRLPDLRCIFVPGETWLASKPKLKRSRGKGLL